MRTYALDRAAQILATPLKTYDIQVPEGERIIVLKDRVIQVQEFTPKDKCLAILRKLINEAKEEEFKRTQTGLDL